jgi:hypothetical protein
MPIHVRCPDCGTEHNLADTLAGKKVRCKGCQAVLSVPAAEEGTPAPAIPEMRPAQRKEGDTGVRRGPAETAAAGQARPRPRTAAAEPPPKKGSGMLWLLVAGVGGLLLCGCCGGIGAAVWFFVLGAKPEDQLVGVWVVDMEATKTMNKDKWRQVPGNLALELNKDGSCRVTQRSTEGKKGTWKVVATKDKGFTIEIKLDGEFGANRMRLTPKDKDRLVLDQCQILSDCELKKVTTFPEPANYDSAPVLKPRAQFNPGFGKAGSNDARIDRIFVSSDGSRVAISSGTFPNTKVQVWDVSAEPKKVYEGNGQAIALAPQGKRLLTLGNTGQPEFIDVDAGKSTAKTNYFASNVYFQTADVVLMMTPGLDVAKQKPLVINFIDAGTGNKIASREAVQPDRVTVAPPVKNGAELFCLQMDTPKIQVFDLDNNKVAREFALPVEAPLKVSGFDLVVSQDGRLMAVMVTGGEMPVATVYNAMTGAKVAELPRGLTLSGRNTAILPNRDVLIAPSNMAQKDKKSGVDFVAYDFGKNSLLAVMRGNDKPSYVAAVSTDGRVLVVGNQDGEVMVWDLTQIK